MSSYPGKSAPSIAPAPATETLSIPTNTTTMSGDSVRERTQFMEERSRESTLETKREPKGVSDATFPPHDGGRSLHPPFPSSSSAFHRSSGNSGMEIASNTPPPPLVPQPALSSFFSSPSHASSDTKSNAHSDSDIRHTTVTVTTNAKDGRKEVLSSRLSPSAILAKYLRQCPPLWPSTASPSPARSAAPATRMTTQNDVRLRIRHDRNENECGGGKEIALPGETDVETASQKAIGGAAVTDGDNAWYPPAAHSVELQKGVKENVSAGVQNVLIRLRKW